MTTDAYNTRPRIAIFGHYGHENLGDEAIIEACIQRYRELIPEADIVLYSSNPADSTHRYSLPAFPISPPQKTAQSSSEHLERDRSLGIDHTGQPENQQVRESSLKTFLKGLPVVWPAMKWAKEAPSRATWLVSEVLFLLGARKDLREVDLLVVTGSNQFLDNFGGPWGFPFSLRKWALLARTTGTKVAYASVGAGPLDKPLSHRLIHKALASASYISLRDEGSRQLIDPEQKFNTHVYPDLAIAADEPPADAFGKQDGATRIAINPMAVYDARYWYISDADEYESYTKRLSVVVESLVARQFDVRLFATQPKDVNVIDDIVALLASRGMDEQKAAALHQPLTTVNELLAFLKSSDIVIPTRFHGTVLGLWAGKPTIGLCYYRKAAEILSDYGQHQYAFKLEEFAPEQILDAIDSVMDNYDVVAKKIAARTFSCQKELNKQFVKLRSLLELPVRQ